MLCGKDRTYSVGGDSFPGGGPVVCTMKRSKMKLTSRSFAEFTASGNLFNYNQKTRKWNHVASGIMTLNYVLSLNQSMEMVFAGTSHKKARHDKRKQIDHQYEISHRSRLRPLERSPGSWAFKALRVDQMDTTGVAENAVIAVNFDDPSDADMFNQHFEALQKQITFQDSDHVKRGGAHKYSRKVRTIREFLDAMDAKDSSTKLMNQPVLRIHERVGQIFRVLGIDDALISKSLLLEILRRFGFVLTEAEVEMLCNIFMLYNEVEGSENSQMTPHIHTDEFMMIFPAALMIQRQNKPTQAITSAELNEQV